MAYTSLIPVRRLDRAITYVRDKTKTAKPSSLEEAVDYALNRDKTESVCFETGLSCLCETAFADMKANAHRWHKNRRRAGLPPCAKLCRGRGDAGTGASNRRGTGRPAAGRAVPGRGDDPSQHRPHPQSHRLVHSGAGQWPQIPQQCQKLLHRGAGQVRCSVSAVWAVGDRNRKKPAEFATVCRMASGSDWPVNLAQPHPTGCGRCNQPFADLAAVCPGDGGKGLHDAVRPQIPDFAAARQNPTGAVQNPGQAIHSAGYPQQNPVSEMAVSNGSTRAGRLVWPPARDLPQSPQAHRPAGFVLSVPVRTGGAAPQAAAPPPRCAAGYPQFGQAHPADGIFVSPRNRYSGAVGYLPPGTGAGSRCAACQAPPTPQGSAERCRQSEVDTDHPKPQAAAAGHPALPPNCRAIGADAKTPAAAGGILPKYRKKSAHEPDRKTNPTR